MSDYTKSLLGARRDAAGAGSGVWGWGDRGRVGDQPKRRLHRAACWSAPGKAARRYVGLLQKQAPRVLSGRLKQKQNNKCPRFVNLRLILRMSFPTNVRHKKEGRWNGPQALHFGKVDTYRR